MESTTDTNISQDALNGLISGGTQSLIPESMQTILVVSFIVLNIVAVVFMIGYILNLARKWKVQTAILKMHDDVADIKQFLKVMADTKSSPTPVAASPVIEPGTQESS